MTTRQTCILSMLLAALLSPACADVDSEAVSRAEQALNVCNASISPTLVVDGIPAYAQCTESTNASIYSNNGVDTATTAASNEWRQTQRSGGYQCTELLHRYWLFKWNVTWLPNGNAGNWCDTTPPSGSGIEQTTVPVHGDAIVFAPGVCGASTTYGHVALIDTVDTGAQKVTFIEQNGANRRTSAWTCAKCFLHVVANAPTPGAGGATSTNVGGSSSAGSATSIGGTFTTSGDRTYTGGKSSTGGTTPVLSGGNSATAGATATNRGGSSTILGVGGSHNGGGATSVAQGGNVASTGMSPATGGASTGSPHGGETVRTGTDMPSTPSSGGAGTEPGGHAGASNLPTTGSADSADDDAEGDPGCSCRLTSHLAPQGLSPWVGLLWFLSASRRRHGRMARRHFRGK
jgi:hypothetical protein